MIVCMIMFIVCILAEYKQTIILRISILLFSFCGLSFGVLPVCLCVSALSISPVWCFIVNSMKNYYYLSESRSTPSSASSAEVKEGKFVRTSNLNPKGILFESMRCWRYIFDEYFCNIIETLSISSWNED